MTITWMLACQRTAKRWVNAFWIATMIAPAKVFVLPLSKTSTLSAHVRLIIMIDHDYLILCRRSVRLAVLATTMTVNCPKRKL